MSIDWDAYRRDYDKLTPEDQERFYDRVWELYPDQKHFDAKACLRFFAHLGLEKHVHVVEVGGWRGELAAEVLAALPAIYTWSNVEVCRGAREASVCGDRRYQALPPNIVPTGDVLVSSHAIEHMMLRELNAYLKVIRPRAVFLAAPLLEDGQDWRGYMGSHVLREGWRDVVALLERKGLERVPELDGPDVRCAARPSLRRG